MRTTKIANVKSAKSSKPSEQYKIWKRLPRARIDKKKNHTIKLKKKYQSRLSFLSSEVGQEMYLLTDISSRIGIDVEKKLMKFMLNVVLL